MIRLLTATRTPPGRRFATEARTPRPDSDTPARTVRVIGSRTRRLTFIEDPFVVEPPVGGC